MKNTNQEVQRLAELRDRLQSKRARFTERLEEIDKQYQAVCLTITLLCGEGGGEPEESPPPVSTRELQGMTQLQAITHIAKKSNGRVRTADATKLLIRAGLMKKTKNSYNITYNVIKRSEKFQPSGVAGEYELIDEEEKSSTKPIIPIHASRVGGGD